MFPLNIFTFHRLEYTSWKYICLIEIWITWFQKELAIPRFKILHINFKKEKYISSNSSCSSKLEIVCSQRDKYLFPKWFRTTKDCNACRSLLLVWQIYSLIWDLDVNSLGGPVTKSRVWSLLIFHDDIIGSLGSGFHNSVWDLVVPDRISIMNDFGNI